MNSFTINKSFYINAEPEAVFDALTRSDDIIKYYPLEKVTSEWEIGGEILLDEEINGTRFRDYGIIQVLSRPTQFGYSYWSDNHRTERTLKNHLTINYYLSPEQYGTRLDLEHNNFKSEEISKMMNLVWDALLSSLKRYVEHRT